MYSTIKLKAKYLLYWALGENGKGHGVHSPFVFELIERVFNDDRIFYYFPLIESAREAYLQDGTISKKILHVKKFDQLFFRLINYFGSSTILELGTSLGITTSYLAAANSNASVITIDTSVEMAAVAKKHFQYLGFKNIEQAVGKYDEILPGVLSRISDLDIVFINDNYLPESTIRYFNCLKPYMHEYSVLVFNHIHISKEMELAWKQIQSDDMVTLTIDLFFVGLVFFRKENKVKQHFTIRF